MGRPDPALLTIRRTRGGMARAGSFHPDPWPGDPGDAARDVGLEGPKGPAGMVPKVMIDLVRSYWYITRQ